ELLAAIYQSRVTAIERAIEDARLREAPVACRQHNSGIAANIADLRGGHVYATGVSPSDPDYFGLAPSKPSTGPWPKPAGPSPSSTSTSTSTYGS
ncbi:hypothetical protein ACWC4J_43265, partial [Streptomyces sp. NPDC001356]